MIDAAETQARGEILAAYRSLAGHDLGPLVELLDAEVEWTEARGARIVRTLRGRDAVALLLERRIQDRRAITLRAAAARPGRLVLSFSSPWWDDRPRLRSLLGDALAGGFVQTIAFERRIVRVDCASFLIASAPNASDTAVASSTCAGAPDVGSRSSQ